MIQILTLLAGLAHAASPSANPFFSCYQSAYSLKADYGLQYQTDYSFAVLLKDGRVRQCTIPSSPETVKGAKTPFLIKVNVDGKKDEYLNYDKNSISEVNETLRSGRKFSGTSCSEVSSDQASKIYEKFIVKKFKDDESACKKASAKKPVPADQEDPCMIKIAVRMEKCGNVQSGKVLEMVREMDDEHVAEDSRRDAYRQNGSAPDGAK